MTRIGQILSDLEPYILQALLGAIALLGLFKDWEDYGKRLGRFRWALLALTVVVFLLTLYETHSTRQEAREKELAAQRKDVGSTVKIETLTEQVRLEREENKQNSDGFRQSFDGLYQKYSDLAARTQNRELLNELSETKKRLQSAEAKFEQPKAKLTASFWYPGLTPETAQRELTTQRKPDGSISVDLVVGNFGDVAALDGSFTVRICDGCKFQKEPEGFTHIPGSSEQDRQLIFTRINPHSLEQRRAFDIVPPPDSQRVEIGFLYTCTNRIDTDKKLLLWINVR